MRCHVDAAHSPHQFPACNLRALKAVRGPCRPPRPPSFHAHYKALVASGAIEADPAQQRAAEAFAALEERLYGYTPFSKQGLLGRLFADKDEPAPRGLYVHGEVGRGKTMLMDLFFQQSRSRTSVARISTNSWPRCMSASTPFARTSRAARSPMAT